MSKKISINEDRINKLVEDKINELDWKTYMNAAKKAQERIQNDPFYDEDATDADFADYDRNYSRVPRFVDAARDAYRKKYGSERKDSFDAYDLGYGRGHNPYNYERSYGDDYGENEELPDDDFWYSQTQTFFPETEDIPSDDFSDTDLSVHSRYGEQNDGAVFDEPYRNLADTNDSNVDLSKTSPEFRDVHNYEHGKSKYTKGKGWNEAVAHAVTENVMRVIRENVQDKIIAKSFIGKVVHTPWAGNQKIQKVDKDVDEDGTPVLVFSGMGLPFMNLTYDEAYCLLEDGVMDNIELVDFPNESIVRNVTENVIRLIKEGVDGAKWTCDEFKDSDYGTYTIQGSWSDYTSQELSAILEDIMVDYVGRDLQENVENYADNGYDNYECVFVKSADDYNPDDGSQICKGYPLSIKLYLKVSGGVEGGVDGDYAYNTWWSAIEEVRLEDSGVDVFFASIEDHKGGGEFLLRAVDGIDWKKVKNNIKPCELEEEDTDFDWAEYEQGLADDAAEARGDRWREEGW